MAGWKFTAQQHRHGMHEECLYTVHTIAHISESASVSACLLYDQFWRTRPCIRPIVTHHILLYRTLTLYIYINATLVRHDLNTGERLLEVTTETIPLTYEVLSILIDLSLGRRPGVSDEKAGQALPMFQCHQKPPD